jgi:ceramide glucosyltransferase
MGMLIGVILAALYLALLLFKAGAGLVAVRQELARHRQRLPLAPDWLCQVSVLQPILSGDPQLAEVLRDNLLNLPQARFYWLVDQDDVVAQTLVARLQRSHAQSQIEVLSVAQAPDGINPKTFKLQAALSHVETDTCLVLDDDARLEAKHLARLVAELVDGDLVTALPCYRPGTTLGARLLAQFVNNNAALTYLPLLPFMQPLSINGMCYCFKSELLMKRGGFGPILTHLTDDLALARLLRARGLRLVQSSAMVEVATSTPTVTRYRQQMHRWFLFATLLLRVQAPLPLGAVVLLQGIHPLLLWAMLLALLWNPSLTALLGLLAVVLLRATVLCMAQYTLTGHVRHRPVLSLLSELLQPLHLMHASLDRTIFWRSRVYRVRDVDDFDAT